MGSRAASRKEEINLQQPPAASLPPALDGRLRTFALVSRQDVAYRSSRYVTLAYVIP
jgi:hypothetical protein